MRIATTFLILTLAAPLTHAQTCTTSWTSPTGGSWSDDANWTAGAPDAGDTACITVPGTYTVTLTGTHALQHLEIGGASGTQTLEVNGTFSTLGSGRIGPNGRLVNNSSAACVTCDGLPSVTGTLLVEGELVHNEQVGLISASGTVDVAPGGRLLLSSGGSAAQVGSEGALLRVRGSLEAECPLSTGFPCTMRAPIEVEGGTIHLLTGRFDLNAGGTIDGLTIETAAETQLWFRRSQIDGQLTRWVFEGQITGTPAGDVRLTGTEVAAGPGGATLDVGGTGLHVTDGSDFTSAGGDFLNTGLAVFQHNTPQVRGVTVANEATLRIDGPNLTLSEGAIIENRPGGTLDLVDQGGISGGPDGGVLVSTGPIVARLVDRPSGSSSINVPVVLEGMTVDVSASRLQFSAGTLRDVTFEVAEESEALLSSANGEGNSGIFVVEGTLGGDVAGTLRLSGGELHAGPDGATLDLGGTGLVMPGGVLASAGGDFLNTGLAVFQHNTPQVRGVTVANEATLRVDGPSLRLSEGTVIENRAGGTVELVGGGSFDAFGDVPGTVVNEGLVLKTEAGTSGFDETLRSQPGSELRVLAGRLDLDPPSEHSVPEGTTVTGTSQVRFIPDLVAEGTISPGTEEEPLATLEFVSSFKLGAAARLVMDIDEDGQSDRVIPASGQSSTLLGGTLVVRPRPGFAPSPGDEWIILLRSANPYDILGEFTSIEVEGDVPEGVGFVTEKPNAGVVVLRAVSGVTIEALAGETSEDGVPVRFRIQSSQPAAGGEALEVPLGFEGTATRYLDYVVDITGSVARIPAGETETTVTVFPLRDDLDEGPETVTLRILPDGDAAPGDPDAATIALADGPPTSALAVGGIAPSRGGNGGQVSATIFGQGFAPGTEVRLEMGGTVIQGTEVIVNETGAGVSARFDLTGAPEGTYDVVAESGGDASTLSGGFTVEESDGVLVWADIAGTPNPRVNRWSTYTVSVGNSGNTDLYDAILLLRITPDIEYEVSGVRLLEEPIPGSEDYVAFDVETATVVPLYLYRLAAGATSTIQVRIKPSVAIGSGVGVSYELYPPNPEATFTYSGNFDAFDADREAGVPTNWGVFWGAFELLRSELDRPGGGASDLAAAAGHLLLGGTRDEGANNPWDRDDFERDANMTDLQDLYGGGSAYDQYRDEVALNAPNPWGEFVAWGLGTFVVGVGAVVMSVPITTAAVIGGGVMAIASLKIAGDSANRIRCSRQRDCTPPGGGGGGSGGGSGGSTGGPGGGPAGGVGGEAGGKAGGSVDPNDKLGPAGATGDRYLALDDPSTYVIRFENLETTNFPAQEVIITDDLDTSVFDLSTFSLGPISWADRRIIPPPGAQSFSTTVDLAPDLPAVLLINAALDASTGRVAWTFTTLDPATNDLPEDGLVGFLPPNVEQPEGEGSVAFSIEMLPSLATHTEVANLAEIVFDVNEPIVTPVWSNRVDQDEPVSSVQPIEPSDEWPVTISVEGSDIGSGIHTYALFVAEGDGPFDFYATSTEPVFEFEGEEDTPYGFYSIAVDHVFNVEPPKDEAEATFAFGVSNEDAALPRALAFDAPYPNPASRTATLRWGLPEAGHVDLRVYDLLGREVARIADGATYEAGWHTIRWEPNLASGTYFVRLKAETVRESKTLVHRVVIVH